MNTDIEKMRSAAEAATRGKMVTGGPVIVDEDLGHCVLAILDQLDADKARIAELERTAAFVHLWVTRSNVSDAERISTIKHRPGWDRFVRGAEPSDELTEARAERDALRAQLASAKANAADTRRDAQRYRKLRSIGAAPNGTKSLSDGLVFVAQILDDWIDKTWPLGDELRTHAVLQRKSDRALIDQPAPERVSDEELDAFVRRAEDAEVRTWRTIHTNEEMLRTCISLRDARAEIARLKEELSGECERYDEVEKLASMWADRATRAEARIASMATVTEALADELKQMIKYARWQYFEGGSHHPTLGSAIGQAEATHEAFVASKQAAAPDKPADAKAPGADGDQLSPGWLAQEIASAQAEFEAMPEGGLKESIRCFVRASNPAPQSDQACRAESDAAFVAAVEDLYDNQPDDSSIWETPAAGSIDAKHLRTAARLLADTDQEQADVKEQEGAR